LVFSLLLFLVSGQTVLEKILDNIEQSGRINATSVGEQVSQYLQLALQQSDFPALNITYSIESQMLTIKCQTSVWSVGVDADFYFFLDSNMDLQVAMLFSIEGTIQQFYSIVTDGKPMPDSVKYLKANGTWEISFSSSAAIPVPIAKGVTLYGSAQVINGTLLEIMHWFRPTIASYDVSASLLIPVFGVNPADVTLTTQISGNIPVSKTLTVSSMEMIVNVPANIEISMNLQATIQGPNNQLEVLSFTISGEYVTNQQTLTLQGDMTGSWAHPFGVKWLTITSAQGKLVLGDDSSQIFSVTAIGVLSFANSPATIEISFSGANYQNVLLAMVNIPVSKKLEDIYSDVYGKSAIALGQVSINGTANIGLSTYSDGKFQEGFTIFVDATLTKGNLLSASQVLYSAATPNTFQYVATLYIPIFSDLGIDFTLAELTAFPVSKHIQCDSYTFTIDVTSDAQVSIVSDMNIATSDGQNLGITVSGVWQVSNEEVAFTGTLNNQWVHPFKLDWLTLETGKIQFVLGGSEMVQLTLQGDGLLSFEPSATIDVIASIGGADLSDVLFQVSGLPIKTGILDRVCYYLLGMSEAPSIIKSLNPQGTASISIATYDSSYAQEGFTFQATVSLSNSGDLYKVTRYFSSDPTSFNFDMSLYIPLFAQTPSIQLHLSENGAFKLRSNIQVNSYSLDVDVSETPSIRVSTEIAVTIRRQPTPLVFDLSVDWNDATTLTLSGSMTSTLDHPFGLKWLDITSLSASLTLSAPAGIQSLSFSGAGDFNFGTDTGSASLSLSMSDDFLDTTLTATVNNQWTIDTMATTILGKDPGELVKDLETRAALSVSITIATESGVSLAVSGQVTGTLQDKLNHVTYWWKKDTNMTFDTSLTLPIFTSDPLAISLSLDLTEEIPLSTHLWFESVAFSISIAPFSISLDARVKAKFKRNPVLFYEVAGSFNEAGDVLMWGALEGTWDNAFGIRGFSLSNVIMEFGFNPAMCGVDFCISDLGLGMEMPIGNKIVQFDGNFAAPDFWDLYLFGALSEKKESLGVLDVIKDWNKVNPNQPVSTSLIPAGWGVYDCSFYFAPEDGQFGPIHYQAGFGVSGSIQILDMDVSLSLNCTDAVGFSCNFAFACDITREQFTAMIKKELLLSGLPSLDIFTLHDVSLTEWSQQNSAAGIHPRWNIDMTVFDKPKKLDFRTEQYQLAGTFHQFFKQFLAHVFD